MTTVRFLYLIIILRFHSFTDKIASHVAVKWLNKQQWTPEKSFDWRELWAHKLQ